MTIANLTTFSSLGVYKKKDGWKQVAIPRMRNARYSADDVAVNNWNRGLTKKDNKIVIGSSPARILIYDLEAGEFEKEIRLEKDIRHAVHGLEILE